MYPLNELTRVTGFTKPRGAVTYFAETLSHEDAYHNTLKCIVPAYSATYSKTKIFDVKPDLFSKRNVLINRNIHSNMTTRNANLIHPLFQWIQILMFTIELEFIQRY